MIIYGLIAYLGIILLIIGYFIVKKIGDRTQPSNTLNEEKESEPSSDRSN